MPLLGGCCCFDLQIGSKIIGVVWLILNLFGFLTTLLLLLTWMVLKNEIFQHIEVIINQTLEAQQSKSNEIGGENSAANELTDEAISFLEKHSDIIMIVFLVALCQQLLDIICTSCLIHGIRQNRRGLLMPWIVTHLIYFIIEIGCIVLHFVILFIVNNFYQIILPVIAFSLFWVAFHIYLILVIISQYQALGLIRMHDEMCMK